MLLVKFVIVIVIVICVYCAQNILSMLWSYDAAYLITKEHMHQPLFTITRPVVIYSRFVRGREL